ncbi:MAG TPA: DUF2182 domain-containing protein [Tepidisphaeraceae bacterium]|jgi:hypothetical protein|nr:DUF2182 domain-containing protein [Tepidisphaeraceae bacterium]
MTRASAISPATHAGRIRQFFWQCPEWWTFVLCGLGWQAMLLHGWQHAAHCVHHAMAFREELQNWMLMVCAMMLPLVRPAVRTTAFASLWVRRHRAMAGFLLGYFTPWLVLGIAVALLRRQPWTNNYASPAIACFAAALWQLAPVRARALTACHRSLPLAPSGWRADRDCLRGGCGIGLACVCACWPLMAACALTGHALPAMIGGMALGLAERLAFRPRTAIVVAGTLALGGYYTLLMFA